MKIKRVVAGYYQWEYRGYKGTISKVDSEPYWYYLIEGGNADDWYSSYNETKLAIVEYVDLRIKTGESPYLFHQNNLK